MFGVPRALSRPIPSRHVSYPTPPISCRVTPWPTQMHPCKHLHQGRTDCQSMFVSNKHYSETWGHMLPSGLEFWVLPHNDRGCCACSQTCCLVTVACVCMFACLLVERGKGGKGHLCLASRIVFRCVSRCALSRPSVQANYRFLRSSKSFCQEQRLDLKNNLLLKKALAEGFSDNRNTWKTICPLNPPAPICKTVTGTLSGVGAPITIFVQWKFNMECKNTTF